METGAPSSGPGAGMFKTEAWWRRTPRRRTRSLLRGAPALRTFVDKNH
jgi:hypothetical protein